MLSFSAFFLAGLMAMVLWLGRPQHRQPWWRVGAGIGAMALVAGIFSWPGTLIMQRGVTALLMPVGLVWLGLMTLAFWAWRRREPQVREWIVDRSDPSDPGRQPCGEQINLRLVGGRLSADQRPRR